MENNFNVEIVERDPKSFAFHPSNPRDHSDESVARLAESIQEDPLYFRGRPILLSDRTGELVVIGGEGRTRAAILLGLDSVPSVVFHGLTEEDEIRIMQKDNTHTGKWNDAKLSELLKTWGGAKMVAWSPNVNWNISKPKQDNEKLDNKYSDNIGTIIYEPKQVEHKISDLYEMPTEFDEMVASIKNKELRKMLEIRKYWFCNFNFAKIADYYAYQATAEEQRVFERLGLVLLDRDQLIENGFAEIIKDFEDETLH